MCVVRVFTFFRGFGAGIDLSGDGEDIRRLPLGDSDILAFGTKRIIWLMDGGFLT